MKNRAVRVTVLFPILLAYSCGKNDSSNDPEPTAPVIPVIPVDPIVPNIPVVPVNPVQPTPVPVPTEDTAIDDKPKLAPLPASGIPAGYQSWDEFNTVDPELRSLFIFDGTDPAQELMGDNPLCRVYVLAGYLNAKSQPTYILRTSFKHNNQSHGWIPITLEKDSTRITGSGSNGQDQIFLQLGLADDLLSATRMNLKWFHINHFDTGVCENLKARPRP